MAEKKYVRATTGFVLADRTIVKAGQIVASDDRVVKGREDLFQPMEDHVEAATRAPGERRLSVKRPDAVVLSAATTRRAQRRAAKVDADKAAAEAEAARKAAEEQAALEAAEAERLAAEQAAAGSNDPPQGGGTPGGGD